MTRRALIAVLAAAGIASGQSPTLDEKLLAEGPAALARAAREKGDPNQGAVLFHQQHLACTKCHSCGGKESPLGPDLARPEKGTTAEAIVESVLAPSKVIRKGYEAVTVTRADGTSVAGLLVEDEKDRLVLRDPARNGEKVVVPRGDVERVAASPTSLMPDGLANLLANRQQFLDLAAYLIESAEFGPARARALRPDPAVINPPLPAYESDLDHAGLIAGLGVADFRRGERIYGHTCATCHGTVDKPGSMPTSLRFAADKFKNGSDPFALYQTLTRGCGLMTPQPALVPREKYAVIHYIREAFLKPHNPTQYVAADAAYWATLPKGASRGPAQPDGEPWAKMDYGRTLMGTFEVGTGGKNIAYKGVPVRLDAGPGGVAAGRAWVVYDHDTMRPAAGWTGQGFIDWEGINFNGKHEVHPHIVGTVRFETPAGPGWADPETGQFDDPRLKGRDGKPYGPLPAAWVRYRGLHHAGDRAVLAYTVGGTDVLETPGLVGTPDHPVFTRTLNLGPRKKSLTLRVAIRPGGAAFRADSDGTAGVCDPGKGEPSLAAGVAGATAGLAWENGADGTLRLRIPAGEAPLRFTLWVARGVPAAIAGPAIDLSLLTKGGPGRWKETLTTQVERGKGDGPFAVDGLPVPDRNPWNCRVRPTGLDFLPGGRAAVCTWDGDVWTVAGLDEPGGELTWRRIASGLFQPLGLRVVGDALYVGCRDQIAVLRDRNSDGETDFVECFNTDHQVTESFHEFAMGLQTDAAGNFYYAKGARHGKTAIVPQHGMLLRVSRDGSKTDILANGFRAPNGVCVNPDGTFFVTDQEGHWTPKNLVNWVRPGRFYGNLWGYTDVADKSDAAVDLPVCWITNRFDRSPAELVRVESKSWGGLDGQLLNLSYGHGQVYVIPHERVGDGMQGGMVALPLPPFPTGVMRGRFHPADGHLYGCGMYAWAGNRQQPGGLYRVRATGKPACLPVGFHPTRGGLDLTFSDPLAPESVADPANFGLKVWGLSRSERYGSPHVGEHPLPVAAAKLSADRRTVSLTVPGLGLTQGLEVWYSVIGSDGREVDGLLHGTIHRTPE